MEHYITTLVGEELELTLDGTTVAISAGGVTIQTECEDTYTAEELYFEVQGNLQVGTLYLDEGRGEIAICCIHTDGEITGRNSYRNKTFTSFKEFVKWGSENRFNLY